MIAQRNNWLLEIALDRLTLGRASLYLLLLNPEKDRVASAIEHQSLWDELVGQFKRAGDSTFTPLSLHSRAWMRFLEGDVSGARADLDEAWDIAERGPMRLHTTDIHLYRARMFFRESSYPWKSPHDDLAAAEKLIHDCGYHRRDEELADAKQAILGA